MTMQVLVQKCNNGIFKSDVCPRVDFQVQVQFLVVVAVNLPQNRRLDIALTTCYVLSLFGYQSFFLAYESKSIVVQRVTECHH